MVLARSSQWPAAASAAQRALDINSQDSVARDIAATAKVAQSDVTFSDDELTALAHRHQQLAAAALAEQDLGTALFHAEWATKISSHPQHWLELARVQRSAGDRAGAIASCRSGLQAFPTDADLHNDLGALLTTDNAEQARFHLQTAVKLRPDFAQAHNNLGILSARGGDWSAAAAHFRRAIEFRPGFDSAIRNLLMAEEELQRLTPKRVKRRRKG